MTPRFLLHEVRHPSVRGIAGSNAPVLVYWNRGKGEQVYLLRYRGGARFQNGGTNAEANIAFRQVV